MELTKTFKPENFETDPGGLYKLIAGFGYIIKMCILVEKLFIRMSGPGNPCSVVRGCVVCQMMKNRSVSIVGAGIGGLSAALFLRKRVGEVRVYESAPAIRPVGAGIVLASNAMQIFKSEGIADRILAAGQRVSAMRITDEKFRNISVVKLARFEQKYGVSNIAIHRAVLQGILIDAVGSDRIFLSKRLLKIETGDNLTLTFEDGERATCETLIGADGIRSTVRAQLFDSGRIRSAGQKCWRGVCKVSLIRDYTHQALEAWGRGKRFGFVRIDPERIYWYAAVNDALSGNAAEDLPDIFSDFHPDALRIIEGTAPDQVYFSEIVDLAPISSWQNRHACLLGDAAHAMTPNMGQGACQAIEDAFAIASLADAGKEWGVIFPAYQRLRERKVRSIVQKSRMMGAVSQIENALAIRLRNSIMRCTPDAANTAQLTGLFDIDYIRKYTSSEI